MHCVVQCCWAQVYSPVSIEVAGLPHAFCVHQKALWPFCSQLCTQASHWLQTLSLTPQLAMFRQHICGMQQFCATH